MGAVSSIASGKRTGLYHVVTGEGQNAFIGKGKLTPCIEDGGADTWATGLGGTSLINANVFLECDKRTLALGAWPPELRKDPDALRACTSPSLSIVTAQLTNSQTTHLLQTCYSQLHTRMITRR